MLQLLASQAVARFRARKDRANEVLRGSRSFFVKKGFYRDFCREFIGFYRVLKDLCLGFIVFL